MLQPLTRKQKNLLEFIETYIKMNGYAPSLVEIRNHFNLRATSTVHEHLENLKKKGYIKKEMNQARGITLLNQENICPLCKTIPVIGKFTHGEEIRILRKRNVSVPADMVKQDNVYYALEVEGNNLQSDFIKNGDILVFKREERLKDGEIYLLTIDNSTKVYLFRYDTGNYRIRLESINKTRTRSFKNVKSSGLLIGLIRKY